MSYDLYFWKQSAPSDLTHSEVLESLYSDNPSPNVLPLPAGGLVRSIMALFPGIVENRTTDPSIPVQLIYDAPDGGVFIIVWNSYVLCVESHGVKGPHLNKIIDAASEYGCKLYDPQTDERYEG